MSFSNNGQILFDDCGVKISEPQMDDLRVGFESRLKLRFYDSKVTTDAGVLSWKFLPCTLILWTSIVAISQDFVIPARFQQLRYRTFLTLRCQISMVFRWLISASMIQGLLLGSLVWAGSPANDHSRGSQHWAFRPLVRLSPPQVEHAAYRTPIDGFVLDRLFKAGLSLSPEADRERLIRRAYIDLIGLPPSPEALDDFLADDRPGAYERLVDELLASPHFGVRWGRHWLDIVGYTDSVTFDDDYGPPLGFTTGKWRYRDYVVQSFNQDKPYDQFLAEQISGDEMVDWRNAAEFTPEIVEHLVATGFFRCCEDISLEDNRPFIIWSVVHDSMTQLGTSALGLSLNCVRCHSHKFDPIEHEEYYGMMALLTPALNPASWKNPEQRALPDISTDEMAELNAHNGPIDEKVKPLGERLVEVRRPYKEIRQREKMVNIPQPTRSELKAALDVAADARSDAQQALIVKHEKEILVSDEEIADALTPTDQQVVDELTKQIGQLNEQRRTHDWIQAMYDVGPPPPTHLFDRGNYLTPGEEVSPRFLAALSNKFTDGLLPAETSFESETPTDQGQQTSGRRTALVRWLTEPQSPASALVARVWANRIWQHLLGEGIVSTSENLGVTGSPPTHPELLEWLATELVRLDWQVKPLIKQIMMSSVYRQSSLVDRNPQSAGADPQQVDPENHLLWRARLRRIEAEVIRDTMLSLSGQLDETMGGPPVPLHYAPDGTVTVAKDGLPDPSARGRRTLYLMNRRIYNPSFLSVFDKPIVTAGVCRRQTSAVATQSLAMMNDVFVLEQTELFAKRVRQSVDNSAQEQIELIYRMALGRRPLPVEQQWCRQFLDKQTAILRNSDRNPDQVADVAMASLCQTVLSTNEFLYLE